MTIVIDRFEGDFAVAELPDGGFANLPRALVPADAGEGSVLRIETDAAETEKRRRKAQDLLGDLLKK